MTYKIISAKEISALEDKVNLAISKGLRPLESGFKIDDFLGLKICKTYLQVMVSDSKDSQKNSGKADKTRVDTSKWPLQIIEIASVPDSQKAVTVVGTKKEIGPGLSGYSEEKSELYGTDRDISLSETLKKFETISFEKKEIVIMQAFNMSFNYVRSQVKEIASAGYTHIQLSPVTKSLEDTGIWWELYQPVTFKEIGNRLGTKEDLKRLVDSAHDAGLKVLVDVVLNHTADPSRRPDTDVRYPLNFNEFKEENFHFYNLYLDYHFYALEAQEQNDWTDDFKFRWFHSENSVTFKNFLTYIVDRNLVEFKDNIIKFGSPNFRWETLRFLRRYIPNRYLDFITILGRKIGKNAALEALDVDSAAELEKLKALKPDQFEAVESTYADFFGPSALIIRLDYWNITYGGVLGLNEWDTLNKAQNKWFPGLPDLDSSQEYVQNVHSNYLKELIIIGIDGFRLDAVKHVPDDYLKNLLLKIAKDEDLPTELLEKEIYAYGEMATNDAVIANEYRQSMAMTDFFLQDLVAKIMVPWNNLSLTELSKKETDAKRNRWSVDKGFAPFLFPDPSGEVASTAKLSETDLGLFQKSYDFKAAVIFSRLHDSVVGTMYKIYDYKATLLTYAYLLAACKGDMLVYGSDENLASNAGPDYKEPVVVAGIIFRHLMSGKKYRGKGALNDTNELLNIDLDESGLCVINRKNAADVVFSTLKDGQYVELISGEKFDIFGKKSSKSFAMTPWSVAYFVPTQT
jgi:hypothetical protein